MIKDKEWLKEKLGNMLYETSLSNGFLSLKAREVITEIIEMADQLEETEITEEQAWDKIAEYYPENRIALKNGFEYWYYGDYIKTSKPVIPQFLADFIESYRNHGLHSALQSAYEGFEDLQVYNWIKNGKREETFARAWLDGYEVEKEKLYTVFFKQKEGKGFYLYKLWGSIHICPRIEGYSSEPSMHHLTEQEIKDYDERMWAFAEEVTHD